MSANATATARIANRAKTVPDAERGHRVRLYALYAIAIASNLAIFFYGFDYYKLSSVDRPFSPKHHLLRPSGPVGLYLGFVGVALFLGIFLYPIRKHWAWLGTKGSTRHWLDIHVLMGLTAPFIVAFHSTLKFKGIAGMAFWIMFAVSTSGVVGRYLYAQIPRKVSDCRIVDEGIAGIAGTPVATTGGPEALARSGPSRLVTDARRESSGEAAYRRGASVHDGSGCDSHVPCGGAPPTCAELRRIPEDHGRIFPDAQSGT